VHVAEQLAAITRDGQRRGPISRRCRDDTGTFEIPGDRIAAIVAALCNERTWSAVPAEHGREDAHVVWACSPSTFAHGAHALNERCAVACKRPLALMPMLHDDRVNQRSALPQDAITHEDERDEAAHQDAFATAANPTPVRDMVRDTPPVRGGGVANLDALQERDRQALRALVQLRLLTYNQLRTLSYPHAHPSVTRRRVQQLVREGVVSVWESPARSGGHTRYALPTPVAVRTITAALARENAAEPFAPLIQLMLPQTTKRALQLAGRARPNWLAHQMEVNALVLRLREATPLRWMSSWDCPFPNRLASFDLPQPDYVIVEQHTDGPRLVLGEHDRGSEPIERFVARKVLLYAALAAFPDACEHLFGMSTFTVRVSVTDPVHRAPMRRLLELLEATRRAGGTDVTNLFRFTLAGWLHAYSQEPIWFAPTDAPPHMSVRWQEHVARHAHAA